MALAHPAANVEAVEITGTIVAGNTDGDDITAGDTIVVTGTNSLFGGVGADITLTGAENQTGVNNPGLGPLADNGGPTQTMALLAGSPAIDTGPATVPSFAGNEFDQRGPAFARVSGGRVDIGAYEVQVPELIVLFTG